MRPQFVLALACLLLLVQCLTFPATRFVEDEGWNSDAAVNWMREGRLRMSSFPSDISNQVDARPPLLAMVMGETFRLFGAGVLQARLSSILAAVGVVAVTYFLGLEMGGLWVACVAALLVACDSFLVITARSARPEPHTAFFSCLGILLYYISRRKDSPWGSFLAAVSIGIAINFHPLAVGYAAAGGLLLLLELRFAILRSPRAWAYLLGLVVSMAPYALWLSYDALHRAAFRETYLLLGSSLWSRMAAEVSRLSDFVGLGNQRLPLPFHIPYRLQIALILAGALIFLFRQRPRLAGELALLLGVNWLWWAPMVNKTPRYIAVLAPVFAVTVAAAIVMAGRTGLPACPRDVAKHLRWKRAAIVIGLIFGLSQLAGNAFLIYRYRTADYESVGRRLREIIPATASVYGVTTFYLALHDRTFYSYTRTPFRYAIANLRPQYLILYDRVMVHGSGFGDDDFAELRAEAAEFVKAHATLAGRVSNQFYGDLEVYRVN